MSTAAGVTVGRITLDPPRALVPYSSVPLRTAWLIALAVLLMLHGAPAVGGELRDPRYAHRPSQQRDPLPGYVRHVAQPALGFPAIVPHGGAFPAILVDVPSTVDPASLRFSMTTGDAAGPALRWPLRIVERTPGTPPGLLRFMLAPPADAPRDVYDLRVEASGLDEVAPRAVRVYGGFDPEFRVVVVADHQLWDPSWVTSGAAQRHAGDFPRQDKDANRAMLRQQLDEIALLDPDFVLYPGDLVFGLDYIRENDEIRALWRRAGFATFIVPGNHDGYAGYEVRLRLEPEAALRAGLSCGSHAAGGLTPAKIWKLLACIYGDLKPNLFNSLTQDGLQHYRRTFGPTEYAFSHGPFLFVGLNTMDGTPERRHAYSFFVDAFDLHLGAPMADNYGGYLSPGQLSWAAGVMQRGTADGRSVIVFGHHDPRGNDGPPGIGVAGRYHQNQPFPTDPLSLEGFKEWSYEGTWDSDPSDGRGAERADDNSGTRLLSLLAEHSAAYISGHVHNDADTHFRAGDVIAGNIKAARPMDFLRVTTASSSARGAGYWGYRLLRAEGRALRTVPFDSARRLVSVPSGNLFVTTLPGRDGRRPDVQILSGFVQAIDVRPRFVLPATREGYRFQDERGAELPVVDLGEADGHQLFRVLVRMPPAGRLPSSRSGMRRKSVRVVPATGNRAPLPEITARSVERGEAPLRAGDTAVLTAERTFDPDGDPVLTMVFELPDGREVRGPEATLALPEAGTYKVALRVRDARGALARVERQIEAAAVPPPVPGGGEAAPGIAWDAAAAGATAATSAGHVPGPAHAPAGCPGCATGGEPALAAGRHPQGGGREWGGTWGDRVWGRRASTPFELLGVASLFVTLSLGWRRSRRRGKD